MAFARAFPAHPLQAFAMFCKVVAVATASSGVKITP
jgi:hypothetical protein